MMTSFIASKSLKNITTHDGESYYSCYSCIDDAVYV
jgi:hypothetical protein